MNETTDERPAVLVATEKDAAQKDKGVKECTGGGANGGGAGCGGAVAGTPRRQRRPERQPEETQ
eukprot:scaffold58944_cov73-Phaeocystis_antarctica.AAC.3